MKLMSFLKKLFKRRKKGEEAPFLVQEEWEEAPLKRSDIVMFIKEQRQHYITNCLEQMKTASEEMDQLGYEYNLVTSYLKDMEEIEALPPEQMEEVTQHAKKIASLETERKQYQGKTKRMSEDQYSRMERLEEDVDEALKKLHRTEDYQSLIKQDLSRIEGEKHAYRYRRSEVLSAINNTRGMAMICACALFSCIAMLMVLQFAMKLDAGIGYFAAGITGAIVITLVFVKHLDAKRELISIDKSINRIILLQNKVKIRYVNNTGLLDYYYLKYQVNSSKELEMLFQKYQAEKQERDAFRKSASELDFYRKELVQVLSKFQLADPEIWMHQAQALVENREMVEIRHNLIIRRQKLRRQMEDNKELAGTARQEIKDIVAEYPQYAQEILDMVSQYEDRVSK